MKSLRYFVAIALMLGLTGVANAYKFQILDPSGTPFSVVPGVPFAVSFPAGSCPSILGGADSGCFFAINNSNVTLTSIELTFQDNSGTNGQPVACDVSNALSYFSDSTCTLANGVYTLDFFGGPGVLSGQQFALVEDCDVNNNCVAPGAFPDGTGIANPTPEPSSLLLALSSMGPLGYVVRRRRRAKA